MIRRLLITGCPRSGNTVMLYAMAGGFDAVPLPGEAVPRVPPFGLSRVVGKMPSAVEHIEPMLHHDPELFVVLMLRDPRDVLASRNFYDETRPWLRSDARWVQAAEVILALSHHPRVQVVRYEELVTDPDTVQQRLASALQWDVVTPWSIGPSGWPTPTTANEKAMWGVRPFDTKSVGQWRTTTDAAPLSDAARDLANRLGYEVGRKT